MRVFATANIGDAALEVLRRAGYDLEVHPEPEAPPHELIVARAGSGIDGLITTLRDRIDEEVFAAGAPAGLKVVAQDSVGFDNIDRAAANRHRIPFTHTPDVLSDATAEFALFMLGAAARKLAPAEAIVREHRWGAWHPQQPLLGDEVTGKTLAVVGVGRIGRAFIRKCLGFDLEILCVGRPGPPSADLSAWIAAANRAAEAMAALPNAGARRPAARPIRLAGLGEALAAADFVVLHVPLVAPTDNSAGTRHLINDETLGWMKPGAILVNTTRGPVVDEAALVRALLSGKLGGAALDVFAVEPLPPESPLRDPRLTDRLRLYPHFASAATITRLSPDPNLGMAGRCVRALRDVLEGGYGGNPANMPWVVNKEAF